MTLNVRKTVARVLVSKKLVEESEAAFEINVGVSRDEFGRRMADELAAMREIGVES